MTLFRGIRKAGAKAFASSSSSGPCVWAVAMQDQRSELMRRIDRQCSADLNVFRNMNAY